VTAFRIAFAGTPEFAVPPLRALLASHHQVIGVLTRPDRPKGRGRQVAPSAVKVVAEEYELPLSQPQRLRQGPELAQLASWQPDLLVVVAYGLILPRTVLDLPRLGCVNIHASLLPRWRGAAPIQRAILAGDCQTGISIICMEAGLDTGPIVLQRAVPILREDSAGSLHDRLALLGAETLLRALDEIREDGIRSMPQPADGVTYAAKLDKKEALLSWTSDAELLERQIRAFNPWPVAETRLDGEQLRIFGGRARAGHPDQLPGTIVEIDADSIVVSCGRGLLEVRELQRAGRRRMSAREFSHSLPLLGRRLG